MKKELFIELLKQGNSNALLKAHFDHVTKGAFEMNILQFQMLLHTGEQLNGGSYPQQQLLNDVVEHYLSYYSLTILRDSQGIALQIY